MTGAKSAQRSGRRNLVSPNSSLAARVLLITSSLLVLAAGSVWAQTSRPAITVAATIPAEAATAIPLVIRIGPPDAVPRGSFVRVRGLPPMAALSEGHSIAPGSWAIPIAALPNLQITLPTAATGRSEISITLVAIDGSILVEAKSVLVVIAPRPADGQAKSGAGAPAPGSVLRAAPVQVVPEQRPAPLPPPGSALTTEDRERALRLLKRGDEQLAEGGIAQARLLYERAAEVGLAQGAMALAATYDAAELDRLGVRGLQPDREAARRWYERARQLGAREAEQRLQRLGAN